MELRLSDMIVPEQFNAYAMQVTTAPLGSRRMLASMGDQR